MNAPFDNGMFKIRLNGTDVRYVLSRLVFPKQSLQAMILILESLLECGGCLGKLCIPARFTAGTGTHVLAEAGDGPGRWQRIGRGISGLPLEKGGWGVCCAQNACPRRHALVKTGKRKRFVNSNRIFAYHRL